MTNTLLTVDELRGYILDAAESDATLQQRIDDTGQELDDRFGPLVVESDSGDPVALAEVTEVVRAFGHTLLPLRLVPAEVVTLVDTTGTTVYDALVVDADYRLRGRHLERANGYRWGARTVVTYVPAGGVEARRRVLIELIRLDMNYAPGMASQGGGGWTEAYAQSYRSQREDIMATLPPGHDLFY